MTGEPGGDMRALVEQMAKVRAGDPLDEATSLGPMARRDLRDSLHEQVRRSVELGARCLLGGLAWNLTVW